jgi:hypothetical protein
MPKKANLHEQGPDDLLALFALGWPSSAMPPFTMGKGRFTSGPSTAASRDKLRQLNPAKLPGKSRHGKN